MTALEWVQRSKIIAIVRGLPKEYMTRLAEALYAGGIDLMEVTFHQQKPETWKDTAEAIAAVDSCMEGKMLVGAGTVLTLEQLDMARDAGASYIITPNTNCDLIRRVKEFGLLSFPGAFTPSEIVEAYEAGGRRGQGVSRGKPGAVLYQGDQGAALPYSAHGRRRRKREKRSRVSGGGLLRHRRRREPREQKLDRSGRVGQDYRTGASV